MNLQKIQSTNLQKILLSLASINMLIACSATENVESAEPILVNIDTQVITEQSALREDANWGVFRKYFEGNSAGTKMVLTGTAEIKPGMEIHPPHTHAEEEYLMVLEGEGTWTVNGNSFAAKAGDMLYAAPWDSHGIKNTGDKTLKFVFWKWVSEH